MSNIAFSVKESNYNFSLIYDEDCQSPRNELDSNISHFYVDPRSRSGHIDNLDDSLELLRSTAKKLKIRKIADLDQFQLIHAIIKADPQSKFIAAEPLYKYEHSGVIYATTPFQSRWDSGQIGYIFSTAKDFERVGLDWNIETAKKYINAEIDLYNKYISGECFGFKVEEVSTCGSCTSEHIEELNACWGYIGEQGEIIKMIANDYLDAYPSLKAKVLEKV